MAPYWTLHSETGPGRQVFNFDENAHISFGPRRGLDHSPRSYCCTDGCHALLYPEQMKNWTLEVPKTAISDTDAPIGLIAILRSEVPR